MKHIKEIEWLMKQTKGHCAESFADLNAVKNIEQLASIYFKYINSCIGRDFPSANFFKRFVGQVERYGVYVDYTGKILVNKNITLIGKCDATLKIDKYNICRIWVRHGSTLSIVAKDNAMVYIDCFENSEVMANATDNAKISVNQYGKAKVIGIGNVPITQTMKNTYSDED
jgi:hypothetical protein